MDSLKVLGLGNTLNSSPIAGGGGPYKQESIKCEHEMHEISPFGEDTGTRTRTPYGKGT